MLVAKQTFDQKLSISLKKYESKQLQQPDKERHVTSGLNGSINHEVMQSNVLRSSITPLLAPLSYFWWPARNILRR